MHSEWYARSRVCAGSKKHATRFVELADPGALAQIAPASPVSHKGTASTVPSVPRIERGFSR